MGQLDRVLFVTRPHQDLTSPAIPASVPDKEVPMGMPWTHGLCLFIYRLDHIWQHICLLSRSSILDKGTRHLPQPVRNVVHERWPEYCTRLGYHHVADAGDSLPQSTPKTKASSYRHFCNWRIVSSISTFGFDTTSISTRRVHLLRLSPCSAPLTPTQCLHCIHPSPSISHRHLQFLRPNLRQPPRSNLVIRRNQRRDHLLMSPHFATARIQIPASRLPKFVQGRRIHIQRKQNPPWCHHLWTSDMALHHCFGKCIQFQAQ